MMKPGQPGNDHNMMNLVTARLCAMCPSGVTPPTSSRRRKQASVGGAPPEGVQFSRTYLVRSSVESVACNVHTRCYHYASGSAVNSVSIIAFCVRRLEMVNNQEGVESCPQVGIH